jgi:hypothetical protein
MLPGWVQLNFVPNKITRTPPQALPPLDANADGEESDWQSLNTCCQSNSSPSAFASSCGRAWGGVHVIFFWNKVQLNSLGQHPMIDSVVSQATVNTSNDYNKLLNGFNATSLANGYCSIQSPKLQYFILNCQYC